MRLIFVTFVTSLAYYFFAYNGFFKIPLVADGLIFSVAYETAHNTFEYWFNLFTSINSHGVQYRPIGFFLSSYTLKALFGTDTYFYRWVSILFMSGTLVVIWQILKTLSPSRWLKGAVILALMVHSAWTYPLLEVTNFGKYILPGFVFSLGLWHLLRIDFVQWSHALIYVFVTTICLMCNEATIPFATVFIAWAWIHKKPRYYLLALSQIPVALYLAARIFIWDIPREGFMAVKVMNFPKHFFLIFDATVRSSVFELFEDLNYQIPLGAFSFVGASVLCFIAFKKSRDIKPTVYLLMTSALISPFAAISNHTHDIYLKGRIWAILPFAVLVLVLIDHFIKSPKNKKIASIFLLFATLAYGFQSHQVYKNELHWYQVRTQHRESFLKEIKTLTKDIEKGAHIEFEDLNLPNGGTYLGYIPPNHLKDRVVASLLANNFPKYKFFIPSPSTNALPGMNRTGVLVQNGSYHRVHIRNETNEYYFQDIFYQLYPGSFGFNKTHSLSVSGNHWGN